jgi:hypothetical protein
MPLAKIDPRLLAFDIDGVVADIMSTFVSWQMNAFRADPSNTMILSNSIWSTACKWMKPSSGKYSMYCCTGPRN